MLIIVGGQKYFPAYVSSSYPTRPTTVFEIPLLAPRQIRFRANASIKPCMSFSLLWTASERHLLGRWDKTRNMNKYFALALAAIAVFAVAEDVEDMGTVIGIDLGTTYSW